MEKKAAIVTAAGRGMGAACARELAAQGYDIALMSVSDRAQMLATELGGIGMQGSVLEPADLNKLVQMTVEKYGRIDAVINNTGHPPKGDLLEISDENWHLGMDLVMMNVIRMAKLVVPVMQKLGGGAFVNISTFAAFEPSLVFPVSSALRAGLGSFTKLFADRYAVDNIRMNNVLPGYIESYAITDETRDSIPMQRAGTVAEVAQTAVFLLSDGAGYITGQNIRVDGGISRSV